MLCDSISAAEKFIISHSFPFPLPPAMQRYHGEGWERGRLRCTPPVCVLDCRTVN